jgi:hypothetical protein
MLAGQGALGATADLRAFLMGNFTHDGFGSRMRMKKITLVSTATALGASPALVGNIVNIRGLSNLTLFVFNSDGAVNATITPYVSFAATAPTALSTMYSLDALAGTAATFVTLANERAAHPLTGITGDWLALAGSGNGADIVAYLMGTVEGFEGH